MFNPHQHQHQFHQHQFHQHLRQLQQLFQQQTPPPPAPPARHITHTRSPARMVNLCSSTPTIIAPNPVLQGALLMQQMQAGGMRGFGMSGQQFPQFFPAGSRASLLGPVPMGAAIKTPHMGFQRHFTPHARYYTNEFQARQPDRKRENEQKSAGSSDSQSEPSSRRDEASAAGCQESSEQPDEPEAKKHKTQESEEPVETESARSAQYKSPDPAEVTLERALTAEADEQSPATQQVESTEGIEQQISESPDAVAVSDSVSEIRESSDTAEELKHTDRFFCYICNITCHNQQSFQSHMNGLTHQQKMMEIQHMSNACLVTLLPRVQETLHGAHRDGCTTRISERVLSCGVLFCRSEKRPGLQRWCSTCQTHFTSSVTEHRTTKEHKHCVRSSSSSCTVCKLHFRTHREFVEHMQSPEHQQRVQQLWKESGKDCTHQLNTDMFLGEEDEECSDDEREEEENGKEGVAAQMEVTLEDLSEDEEFDSDTVYGSSFVVPVAGFICRLCDQFYHYESAARHTHCKTLTHFRNLKLVFVQRYKALKKQEDSGSTSGEPADHISPDPDPAPQTLQSCGRQEVETLTQEEDEAREPIRGRTPAQRRGRGGRRR
ncbi:cip1-interacting zinc finger protein-like isoform X3 [Carassius auratus]|uniref:Cip1-interacting zinc finger protein-like isoform X3 n=1 Tax=Carassius auratus TaxID=7957 RepID=A0A6P6MVD3_CARAU|nr:cip1-interacting zinc finger protein-like isoform X3 [Carassius auratus]